MFALPIGRTAPGALGSSSRKFANPKKSCPFVGQKPRNLQRVNHFPRSVEIHPTRNPPFQPTLTPASLRNTHRRNVRRAL
jgi:hypothetical protein